MNRIVTATAAVFLMLPVAAATPRLPPPQNY